MAPTAEAPILAPATSFAEFQFDVLDHLKPGVNEGATGHLVARFPRRGCGCYLGWLMSRINEVLTADVNVRAQD